MAVFKRSKSLYWREASTLILAAPRRHDIPEQNANSLAGDFEVLMLKRNAKSSFLPDAYVFPGGVVDKQDFDRERWARIYKENANLSIQFIEESLKVKGYRPYLLEQNDNSDLSQDVGLRICALREAFEESGVLLVCDGHYFKSGNTVIRTSWQQPPMYKLPRDVNVETWRQRVRSDASQFQELCETYGFVPNVWALYEWSNWLTPVVNKIEKPPERPRRFDTMFYLCCLDAPLEGAVACSEETFDAQWWSPREWKSGYLEGSFKFIGPQLYEIDRLSVFQNKSVLREYIHRREPLGMVRYLPVVCVCRDGFIFLLPGDELYPDNPDADGTRGHEVIDEDLDRLMTITTSSRFHRSADNERTHIATITQPFGLLNRPASLEGKYPNPMEVLRKALAKI